MYSYDVAPQSADAIGALGVSADGCMESSNVSWTPLTDLSLEADETINSLPAGRHALRGAVVDSLGSPNEANKQICFKNASLSLYLLHIPLTTSEMLYIVSSSLHFCTSRPHLAEPRRTNGAYFRGPGLQHVDGEDRRCLKCVKAQVTRE